MTDMYTQQKSQRANVTCRPCTDWQGSALSVLKLVGPSSLWVNNSGPSDWCIKGYFIYFQSLVVYIVVDTVLITPYGLKVCIQ
ncbi:hypothetical protein LY76DRAFT_319774 [Colletotrichum caudatum]|nr:hypothetical protein LY76DRAFT_319774 [Colletotrichum caudatum]